MHKLNIIGGGKVGQTVGRLVRLHARDWEIAQVLNRNIHSATAAVTFIGAGAPIAHFAELSPAEVYLLAVPDDQIETVALALSQTNLIKPGNIVFHCSGLKPATALQVCQAQGAQVASVHPLISCADPKQAIKLFSGSYCGLEGETFAVTALRQLFTQLGAQTFVLSAAGKSLYHAGSVFIANYLVVLVALFTEAIAKHYIFPSLLHCFRQFAPTDFADIKLLEALLSLSKHENFGEKCAVELQPKGFCCKTYFLKLWAIGLLCYQQAGVPREKMLAISASLIDSVIHNLQTIGIQGALTGPLVRGDINTLAAHRIALMRFDKRIAQLYQFFASYVQNHMLLRYEEYIIR